MIQNCTPTFYAQSNTYEVHSNRVAFYFNRNNVFPPAFKILTKNDTSFFHKNKLNQVAHFFPPSPLKTENPYRLIQNWVTLPSLHGKIKPIWLAFLKPINQNFEEKNT